MSAFAAMGILLDIEGTTSSVSFVYDVLFPYARRQLENFVQSHWSEAAVQAACDLIARDAGANSLAHWALGGDDCTARQKVIAEVRRLMNGDVKATGLKELQGLIWREGYLSGQLCSHVFDDVPPALKAWTKAGKDVRIYSSGSVTAQRLFFTHTDHGDLSEYLRGHYDTTTGPKREPRSYRAIASEMGVPASKILFMSDTVAELDAARAAGMQTALVLRPGNAPAAAFGPHPYISSFAELDIS